jgi:hypothetical protein
MLHAIINGKGRRLPESVSAGDSLRKVFTKSEDILTSTVFERLAYLSGPLLWQILDSTFTPRFLPSRKVVELNSIEFWPTWGQSRESLGKAVEPDVVLHLSAGDPPQSVVLIVECKLGGSQDPDQWAQEWLAYEAEYASSESPDQLWLLALGGLPFRSEETVTRFLDRIRRERDIEVKAAAADWLDLLRALDTLELRGMAERRIVLDIKQALDLHGYRAISPMWELGRISVNYGINDGSTRPLRWDEPPTIPHLVEENMSCWVESVARFRPIGAHPQLRW